MAISPTTLQIAGLPSIEPLKPAAGAAPGEFQSALSQAVNTVENSRRAANQSVERFLSGQGEELHSAILATQRAEMQLELGLQVRNKVVQAYQEIMRMQL